MLIESVAVVFWTLTSRHIRLSSTSSLERMLRQWASTIKEAICDHERARAHIHRLMNVFRPMRMYQRLWCCPFKAVIIRKRAFVALSANDADRPHRWLPFGVERVKAVRQWPSRKLWYLRQRVHCHENTTSKQNPSITTHTTTTHFYSPSSGSTVCHFLSLYNDMISTLLFPPNEATHLARSRLTLRSCRTTSHAPTANANTHQTVVIRNADA